MAVPECNISTIVLNDKYTLFIENESNSFTFREDEDYIVLKPSVNHGLTINDSFCLNNNNGYLAYIDSGYKLGDYVAFTGNYFKLRDLYCIEVELTNKNNIRNTCGIIKETLTDRFVENNKLYLLDNEHKYITFVNKGVHYCDTKDFNTGDVLIPSINGESELYNQYNNICPMKVINKDVILFI